MEGGQSGLPKLHSQSQLKGRKKKTRDYQTKKGAQAKERERERALEKEKMKQNERSGQLGTEAGATSWRWVMCLSDRHIQAFRHSGIDVQKINGSIIYIELDNTEL